MHANEILMTTGVYPGLNLHLKAKMGPVGRDQLAWSQSCGDVDCFWKPTLTDAAEYVRPS